MTKDKFDRKGNLVDVDLQKKICNLIDNSLPESHSEMLRDTIDITVTDLDFHKETYLGPIYISSFTSSVEPTIKDIVMTVGKPADEITQEDIDCISEEDLVEIMTETHHDEIAAKAEEFAEDENEMNAFGATFGKYGEPARWGGSFMDKEDSEIEDGYFWDSPRHRH